MEGILTQNTVLALLVVLVPLLQVVAMPISNCNITTAEVVDLLRSPAIENSPPQFEINDATVTFTNYKDLILEAEQYVGGASITGDNCTYGSPCGLERDVHSLYPMQYHCTYDINRIPQYLCRATCEQSCNSCPPGYTREPVYYKLPILYISNGENCNNFLFSTHTTWSLALEDVATSCSCQRTDQCHT